jgi:hypothetical protein
VGTLKNIILEKRSAGCRSQGNVMSSIVNTGRCSELVDFGFCLHQQNQLQQRVNESRNSCMLQMKQNSIDLIIQKRYGCVK